MLHIRREILRKNNGKSRFFHHSPSLYGSFLVLCRVVFRRGCQNCHRIVPRNSLVESNSFRIKFFSGHWAKFLRPCGNFFQVELSKLYVSIERFSEQIFFWKHISFYHNFGTLMGSLPAFWQIFFAKSLKTATYMLRGTV